jgi:hypothetical protein
MVITILLCALLSLSVMTAWHESRFLRTLIRVRQWNRFQCEVLRVEGMTPKDRDLDGKLICVEYHYMSDTGVRVGYNAFPGSESCVLSDDSFWKVSELCKNAKSCMVNPQDQNTSYLLANLRFGVTPKFIVCSFIVLVIAVTVILRLMFPNAIVKIRDYTISPMGFTVVHRIRDRLSQ